MGGNHDGLSDEQLDEAVEHVDRHRRGHSDEGADDEDEPIYPSDGIFRQPGPP